VKVVIVGTGKIGCGYLAPLFAGAGWQVALAARTEHTAAQIRRFGGFRVRVTGDGGRLQDIDGVCSVVVGTGEFEAAVADADLVATAVGVDNVAGLGPALAGALAARGADNPIDVWVVENQDRAGELERAVGAAAAAGNLDLPSVGFAGGVAAVAVGRGAWGGAARPEFVGDGARMLSVDRSRLCRPLPCLPGVRGTSQYLARLREKLFVFNTGHALCAYLGALRRHTSVDRAVADPALRPLVVGCLLESRKALLRSHPRLGSDVHGPVAEALARYGDAELADPVARVARDPLRKLAPGDRLLGPAEQTRAVLGKVPAHFALGIAGALLYRNPADAQACRLADLLRRQGVASVLGEVCGLDPVGDLATSVARRYRGFILTSEGAVFPPVHEPGSERLLPEPEGPS